MQARPGIGTFEHQVLATIAEMGDAPAYGLSIYEQMPDPKPVLAQLYIALRRLEAPKQLLSSQLVEPRKVRGGRTRREFTITDKGREVLEASTEYYRALAGIGPARGVGTGQAASRA